jgi:hypothetical protein
VNSGWTKRFQLVTTLDVTNELRGDLGELYFKHLCTQRSYAYTRLEDIYNTLSPRSILEFKMGFDRLKIEVPKEISGEVWEVCKPQSIDGSPSYVFDFLTCKIDSDYFLEHVNSFPPNNFHWVEVKTGKSRLSRHQEEMRDRCKMQFDVFRIENVDVSPHEVAIHWEEAS